MKENIEEKINKILKNSKEIILYIENGLKIKGKVFSSDCISRPVYSELKKNYKFLFISMKAYISKNINIVYTDSLYIISPRVFIIIAKKYEKVLKDDSYNIIHSKFRKE